jgi:serine/threonine protein kinase
MFTATDNTTGDQVAVKVYHPEQRDPYRRACFEREEALLRSLSGQRDIIGWVAPRDVVIESLPTGMPVGYSIEFQYYALELASADLRQRIAGDEWDIRQALAAFRQACRGVQRLHQHEIVHRDLKPENLLVTSQGVVVSDLGAARRLDGTLALRPLYDYQPGDVRYAAPEMLACVHDALPTVAYQADIYALGAILFECVTGQILGLRLLLDPDYLSGLAAICMVDRAKRAAIYHEVLPQLADRTMPSLSEVGGNAPDSIRDPLEALYRDLTHLDYRKRLTDFQRIFRRIDTMLLILDNNRTYLSWKAGRDARRAAHRENLERRERRAIAERTA